MAWYPGKKLVERRKKRKKEGKWYLGKNIGKAVKGAGKAAKEVQKTGRAVQAKSRLKKDLGLKVTTKQAKKYGKVRKGAVGAEMTKGGAYVKYKK